MVAIALSLLAAIGLGGGAVSARGAMPGVHPLTTIVVSLVVGFVGVAIVALAFAIPTSLRYHRPLCPGFWRWEWCNSPAAAPWAILA